MHSVKQLSLLLASSSASASDVKTYLDDVAYQAKNLQQKIDSWTADAGLAGALTIQQSFPDLQSSVTSLISSLQGASDSDIQVDSTQSMVDQIASLLDSLSSKEPDFKSIGADTIVGKDISSLVQPAQEVVNDMAKAVSSNCQKVSDLNPSLQKFSDGFNNAGKAYGIDVGSIPSSISCSSGSSSSASSSSSSSDSGSSSDSSSPTSTSDAAPLPRTAISTITSSSTVKPQGPVPTAKPSAKPSASGAPANHGSDGISPSAPAVINNTLPRNGSSQPMPILPNGASMSKPAAAGVALMGLSLLL